MSMPAFAATEDKVDICHFDLDYGVWKLISISDNAVEGHFNNHDDGLPHGETLGTTTLLDDGCEPAVALGCYAHNQGGNDLALLAPLDTASNIGFQYDSHDGTCSGSEIEPATLVTDEYLCAVLAPNESTYPLSGYDGLPPNLWVCDPSG
jgi:hypothetical protein